MATIKNIYALLNDDVEGESDTPTQPKASKKQQQDDVEARRAAGAAAAAGGKAKAPKPAAAPAPAAPIVIEAAKPEKTFGQDKAPRKARPSAGSQDPKDQKAMDRPRKPAGEGRANADRPVRTSDRESGTGRVKSEQKKSGAGKNNWGKPVDKAVEGVSAKDAVAADAAVDGAAEPAAADAAPAADAAATDAAAADAAPAVPAEPPALSLAEWQAKQAKPLAAFSSKPRQANEGLDKKTAKEFEKFVPLKKDLPVAIDGKLAGLVVRSDAATAGAGAAPADGKAEAAKPKKAAPVVAVSFKAPKVERSDPRDDDKPDRPFRGGRGGRGGGRGGATGSSDRRPQPASQQQGQFEVNDAMFPSLGNKA